MSIEQQILLLLTSGSPSPTLAGDRVYGMLAPQVSGAPQPAVTYHKVAPDPVIDLDGHSNIDQPRMQVDCWGRTYGEAKQLAQQVRAILTASSILALLETEFDEYEPDTRLYRVSSDYQCWEDRTL